MEAGHAVKAKVCTCCREILPVDQFHKHPETRSGLQSRCKACIRKAALAWRAANYERYRELDNAGARRRRRANRAAIA